MGDRGNVILTGTEWFPAPVVLYSHWGGSDLADRVAEVIAKRALWDDEAYLARRIAAYVWGADATGETGSGLSTGPLPACGHPLIVVDFHAREVGFLGASRYRPDEVPSLPPKEEWAPVVTYEQIANDPKILNEAFLEAHKIWMW